MMSEEQKKVYIDLIGAQHITKIRNYLTENGYLNQWKNPFSQPFISNVFHGKVRHEKVEKGIWAFISELVERKTRQSQAQNSLFDKAKNLTNVSEAS